MKQIGRILGTTGAVVVTFLASLSWLQGVARWLLGAASQQDLLAIHMAYREALLADDNQIQSILTILNQMGYCTACGLVCHIPHNQISVAQMRDGSDGLLCGRCSKRHEERRIIA